MELLGGVERANPKYRDSIALHVEAFLAVMPIESYDLAVARMHASLLTHTHRTGKPRGAIDLIIAATAAATDRVLVTTDATACFDDLPGVSCLVVPG